MKNKGKLNIPTRPAPNASRPAAPAARPTATPNTAPIPTNALRSAY